MLRPEIETFQNEWELEKLVQVFHSHLGRPDYRASVLEVGTWHGGTLWYWLEWAGKVVVVDDAMRREKDWYQWAAYLEADLYLYQGYSNDDVIIHAAQNHAPYDFLFIDAAHDYDSVRADWNNYSPMVREGGLVAFHDILPRPGYGVSQLWEELTSVEGTRYMTICANEVAPGNEGRCGIGLIYL